MSIYKEIKQNPTRRDLFEFGLIFAGGTGLLGLVNQLYLHKPGPALGFWIAGAVVFALSLIPPIGRLLYILWMGLGLTIGFVTSPVIMFVVYAIVIVPVGLWFKLTHRDTMRRQLDPKAKSYWEDYPGSDDPASYIRQF
jgi:hypothetical protein